MNLDKYLLNKRFTITFGKDDIEADVNLVEAIIMVSNSFQAILLRLQEDFEYFIRLYAAQHGTKIEKEFFDKVELFQRRPIVKSITRRAIKKYPRKVKK